MSEDVRPLDSGDVDGLAEAQDEADSATEAEQLAQPSEQAKALFEAKALATDSADANAAFDASVAEMLATHSDAPTMPEESTDAAAYDGLDSAYDGLDSAAAAAEDAVEHATDIGPPDDFMEYLRQRNFEPRTPSREEVAKALRAVRGSS